MEVQIRKLGRKGGKGKEKGEGGKKESGEGSVSAVPDMCICAYAYWPLQAETIFSPAYLWYLKLVVVLVCIKKVLALGRLSSFNINLHTRCTMVALVPFLVSSYPGTLTPCRRRTL